MKTQKCLGCYESLEQADHRDYHPSCSRKLFSTNSPPDVPFDFSHLEDLAKKTLSQHLGLTGVQPKVSVHVEKKGTHANHRITIVGLWGNYILKPPSLRFPDMPVVEDLTMHLAQITGLQTAQHGLLRLQSGELAYITRRFDRGKKGEKIALEDFCQLSQLLTERKYKTSMEKAGKIILKYSSNPGLDCVTFFDLTLFSFLTGNADMHLKNFSLLTLSNGDVAFSPAYDLVATRLMPVKDEEEMALTVNGKKAKLKREDFLALGETLKIPQKAVENCFSRLENSVPKLSKFIRMSFLSTKLKEKYEGLLTLRSRILWP